MMLKNWVSVIFNLLKNNSFVFSGPFSGFCIIVIIAKISFLEIDKIYLLVLGLLAFTSLADGGIPFRLKIESGDEEVTDAIYKVLANVILLSPLLPIILAVMLFQNKDISLSSTDIAAVLCFSGLAAVLKTLSDSLRVIGMRSARRNVVDQASSMCALMRASFAFLFVNDVPFLYVYSITLLIEFGVMAYLSRERLLLVFVNFSILKIFPKFSFNAAYLLANIGYITGFNVDRIFSFHFLSGDSYKSLVMTASLLGMSILPNKILENVKIFPGNYLEAPKYAKFLALASPLIGVLAFVSGLWIFNSNLSFESKILNTIISFFWVPATIYYNNIWASHLRYGGSSKIARMTLLAGLMAALFSFSITSVYENFLIPFGLIVYSFFNAVSAYWLHKSR